MKDIAMNECELIPNRVFVGALPLTTTEPELKEYFNKLTGCDNVKEVKIIIDFKGSSKGFGFVTFETETEASTVLNMKSDSLTFKEAKLNIAPALRRIKPYQNNSKYHRNDQASSMTVQTENIKADRFCMSPNSGKVLNLFTPSLTSMTDAKSEAAVAGNNQAIDTQKSGAHMTEEADSVNKEAEQTDVKTNECIEIGTMDKKDDNNNIITTKIDDLSKKIKKNDGLDGSQKEAIDDASTATGMTNDETAISTQLDTDSLTNPNSKPNNNYNKGNQRTYNNNRNKGNNRYQQNANYNQHLTIQTHGNNYNGNKNGNQFSTGSQSKAYQHHASFNQSYGNVNASIQYYYAMAAAMSGNMHSPKTSSNPMYKQKYATGESLKTTSIAKSSNDFVGSIMHGTYQNVYASQPPPAVDQAQQFAPLPVTNYQAGTYQTSQQTTAPKSSKMPYGYGTNGYSNQQPLNRQGSSNFSESTSGYVNSSSTQSNASSSSSSVTSNTPNTVNQVTAPQAIPYSNSTGYTNVGANNTAVNYVNHVASLNSSTLTGQAPQQHGINENYAPQYPSQYYYPVNQPNMQQNLKNGELNTVISTDQMGQQANYDQNQPKSVYYASSLPNSASTVAQAEPDATKNNYQKQAVSTISSAFETATNNSGTESNNNNAINSDQSADNLDELIQNKLTLQTSTEATNNQPPQPQYYYIAQPYTQNNPTDNSQAPPQPQPIPQYYYYYTPNSTAMPGQQQVPHYQYPVQPIPSYIPAQQQPGMPLNGAYMQPAPPSTYPIQVNTMNANHLSMPNNPGPHSAPLPHYMPPVANYPNQQQQHTQYQMVGGMPLLQMPPPSARYQQHPHAVYPNGQYADNHMQLQSPNPQGNTGQGAKGPQQMTKNQFYQNHMYPSQPRGAVRQRSFTKSDSIPNRS